MSICFLQSLRRTPPRYSAPLYESDLSPHYPPAHPFSSAFQAARRQRPAPIVPSTPLPSGRYVLADPHVHAELLRTGIVHLKVHPLQNPLVRVCTDPACPPLIDVVPLLHQTLEYRGLPFRLVNDAPSDQRAVKLALDQRTASRMFMPEAPDAQWDMLMGGSPALVHQYARDIDYKEDVRAPIDLYSTSRRKDVSENPFNQARFVHDRENLFSVFRAARESRGGDPRHGFGYIMPGLMTPYGYSKVHRDHFCWHIEQYSAPFVNQSLLGANMWYIVPFCDHDLARLALVKFLREYYDLGAEPPGGAPEQTAALLMLVYGKRVMVPPCYLRGCGVTVYEIDQRPGDVVIGNGACWHAGLNLEPFSFNVAVNALPLSWLIDSGTGRCFQMLQWVHDVFSVSVRRTLRASVGEALTNTLFRPEIGTAALNHIAADCGAPLFCILREQVGLLLSLSPSGSAEAFLAACPHVEASSPVAASAEIRSPSSSARPSRPPSGRAAAHVTSVVDRLYPGRTPEEAAGLFADQYLSLRRSYIYLSACEALYRHPVVVQAFRVSGLAAAPEYIRPRTAVSDGDEYAAWREDYRNAVEVYGAGLPHPDLPDPPAGVAPA